MKPKKPPIAPLPRPKASDAKNVTIQATPASADAGAKLGG